MESRLFYLKNIKYHSNADKLFRSLLLEIEYRSINPNSKFTIFQITKLTPVGTSGIENKQSYGYALMGMFGNQRNRDYFIFDNDNLSLVFKIFAIILLETTIIGKNT